MEDMQPFFLPELPDKKPDLVSGWNMHRCLRNKDSKRITLFEIYRYFPKEKLPALLKFLQTKQFTYTTDTKTFPSVFNPLRAKEGKVHNGQGDEPSARQHSYLTHFARVITHRNQPYLLRVYECLTNNYSQVKFEILHAEPYVKTKNKRRIYGLANPLHKLRAMNEIRKRVDKRFKPDLHRRYLDHSKGNPMKNFLKNFFEKSKKETPKDYKRMEKHQKEFSDLFGVEF